MRESWLTQQAALTKVADVELHQMTAEICQEYNIHYQLVENHNDLLALDAAMEADASLAVLGDTRILHGQILTSFERGIINVHPGCLPEVRGNHPYIWATIHGLPQGATAHFINDEVDMGPIIHKELLTSNNSCGLPGLIRDINALCAQVVVSAMNAVLHEDIQCEPQPCDGRLTFRGAPDEVRALAHRMLDTQ